MFGVTKSVGDGFAGFLSIFNMGGRFVWSSTSDYTGRKNVYFIYFLFGALLYCLVLGLSFVAFFYICDLGFRRSIETTVNEASRSNLEISASMARKSRLQLV